MSTERRPFVDNLGVQRFALRTYLTAVKTSHPEYADAVDSCLRHDAVFSRFHDRCLREYNQHRPHKLSAFNIDPELLIEFIREHADKLLKILVALLVVLGSEPDTLGDR